MNWDTECFFLFPFDDKNVIVVALVDVVVVGIGVVIIGTQNYNFSTQLELKQKCNQKHGIKYLAAKATF